MQISLKIIHVCLAHSGLIRRLSGLLWIITTVAFVRLRSFHTSRYLACDHCCIVVDTVHLVRDRFHAHTPLQEGVEVAIEPFGDGRFSSVAKVNASWERRDARASNRQRVGAEAYDRDTLVLSLMATLHPL